MKISHEQNLEILATIRAGAKKHGAKPGVQIQREGDEIRYREKERPPHMVVKGMMQDY